MIIREITIKNFRSYYGENHLILSKGLTLIIGDNGDGKTTFFDALVWLFDTTGKNSDTSHISAKRKAELSVDESDEVKVSIKFEHNGEKEIEKSFTFTKTAEGKIQTENVKFDGYSTEGTERLNILGKDLLDYCFEPVIRKYCLFRGENELNVFAHEAALKTLVDTFSDIRDFEPLVNFANKLESKASKAEADELKKDIKVAEEAKKIENEWNQLIPEIEKINTELKEKQVAIEDYTMLLNQLEDSEAASKRYQEQKELFEARSQMRNKLEVEIKCDYSTNLLDEQWILRSFPSILREFTDKVTALNKQKRRLEKEETERRAKAEGAREAIAQIGQQLANNTVPLPWYLPDEATMREMLEEKICKVCNREAPEGSAAYEFMHRKLQEYIDNAAQQVTKQTDSAIETETPFFPNAFIDELRKRQIRMGEETESEIAQISQVIKERLEEIARKKVKLAEVESELASLEIEQKSLEMQSGLKGELLEKNFHDFRGFFETKGKAEADIVALTKQLSEKEGRKAELEAERAKLNPESTLAKNAQRVHKAFERIYQAFYQAKELNAQEFLQNLQAEANRYLEQLNRAGFHGLIRLTKTANDMVRINLLDKEGQDIKNPNGALETAMYMALLFGISQVTTLSREQDYPLIFDAPTSSFGSFMEATFYNVIDNIDKQCIIATKDFITEQRTLDEERIGRLSCSVYRIAKAEGFNSTDLSTVQTTITKIK